MQDSKFSKYKIQFSLREQIEPEEIFFDSSKIKEFAAGELEAGKLETPISPIAFRFFLVAQIISLVFIGAITAFLIGFKGGDYTLQAQANTLRAFPISAPRGIIFSSDSAIIAENEIYFDLVINAAQSPPDESYAREISYKIGSVLKIDPEGILERFGEAAAKRFSEYTLFKGISREELDKLEEIITGDPFFEVKQVYRRNYPGGEVFSHILGYTGEISSAEFGGDNYYLGERVGKSGIEAFYDSFLRGSKGMLIKKINSRGEVFSQDAQREAHPGKDLSITINSRLQKEVYEILRRHAKDLKIASAAAILEDPRSGAILALVSLPSFDANLFEGGIARDRLANLFNDPDKPLFNRAIAGEYPSGSTIKPLIAAAALEERLVTPDFLVYSGGSISVPSVYNSEVTYEFEDWKAHGWTDLRKAIADSVNIYFYTIGGGYQDKDGLGIKKIEEYLAKFGWGSILGVDIPGERGGLIPSPRWKKEVKGENWYIGDTYLVSIGQGDLLITPLQLAAATAVFANGGTLFTPYFVEARNSDVGGNKIIHRNFIASKNIEIVREGMRRAVTSGSSRFLTNMPYAVAGKTGTAQTGREKNHAWFTGFAPYEDPKIVLTVLLEEGDNSNYAVRAAKDILDVYFDIYYPQN